MEIFGNFWKFLEIWKIFGIFWKFLAEEENGQPFIRMAETEVTGSCLFLYILLFFFTKLN
jgi:hypothetical protein